MTTKPLERKATPELLRMLVHDREVTPAVLERVLEVTGAVPSATSWRRFVDRALLFFGSAFLLAGIIFFFAFNWEEMGKFLKMGLVFSGIAFAALYAAASLDRLTGKSSLLAAAVLLGVLLAVYGQTYQTGADLYQLFASWTLMILVWAAVARFAPLWCLVFVTANLTILQGWDFFSSRHEIVQFEAMLVFNAAGLAAWELAARGGAEWMSGRWLPRLLSFTVFGYATAVCMMYIVDSENAEHDLVTGLGVLLYFATLVASHRFNAHVTRDIVNVAFGMLSFIIVAVAYVVDVIPSSEFIAFLIASIMVATLAAISAKWLYALLRSWEPQE